MHCKHCHNPCSGDWLDFGIGGYEFWGQRGQDANWQFVSDCCEAEVIDSAGNVVSPDGPDEHTGLQPDEIGLEPDGPGCWSGLGE